MNCEWQECQREAVRGVRIDVSGETFHASRCADHVPAERDGVSVYELEEAQR